MASSLISNSHHIDFDIVFDMEDAGLAQNLIFDARSLFSESKEQVSISCLKKELKIQYRLLHDILAKTLFVKAGSFDAVTRDRFLLMTTITFDVKINWSNLLFGVLKAMVTPGSRQAKGFAIQIGVILQNVQGLVLGESKGFPKSRILDAKTVHRFVHINEKVGLEESAASPRVKKTPVKKAVSLKRPAVDAGEAPVVKKKRTTKGKPVVFAQEAVPLQIDVATTIAPVEQLYVPKRKEEKEEVGFGGCDCCAKISR
ncbi:patatin-like protein 2 [Dorcoceras hygrometricum]|uniref:Patatin-like protein 2 n=1 Tax=Dorcoceras hygrometricum TaxID=472368 RepID=A0A2Z7AX04_9LAMI|nr:patatin-like protein 2 [Dorcoceras hygrometricum]